MSRRSRGEVGFQGLVHTRHRDDPGKEPRGAWLISTAAEAPPGPDLWYRGFTSRFPACRATPAGEANHLPGGVFQLLESGQGKRLRFSQIWL